MRNENMKPSIQPEEHITVDMSAYRFRSPRRWDVVVFHPKDERYKDDLWVMRVVGLPGERITHARGGNILVDDKAPEQPPQIRQIEYKLSYQSPFDIQPVPLAHPLRMPPDGYYLLGDNIEGANDSRYWGALPRKNIVGKVLGK